MKHAMLTKYKLILLFIVLSTSSLAHPGGHYHSGDGIILNTWQLKNGAQVKGNFSKGNSEAIVLEQEDGKFISIAIKDLCEQDRQLAAFKVKRFERLNEAFVLQPAAQISIQKKLNYGNLALSILLGILLVPVSRKAIPAFKQQSPHRPFFTKPVFISCMLIALLCAFKKTSEHITTTIPKTSTAFIDSAFSPYKPAVKTRWDENYFYIESNGIPAHNMMTGISSWQQQVPIPQDYTGNNSWSIPLQAVYADVPLSTKTNFMKGAVAIAVNGVPIFNALNNRGDDAFLVGELDNWGGHCGRGDDYHYHIAPLHLTTTSGLMPIAFALDGFPVYGTKEPDGSPMRPLDSCHGHIVGKSLYHYHGTSTYPYVIAAMKGKVSCDPRTPAPENQILPQAFASPFRPPGKPLRGAVITGFTKTASNNYLLTYKLLDKTGSVQYSWDENKYVFLFTDIDGNKTTNEYQKKKR